MAKREISEVLKRNLKDGKEYNKLIPRVKCESTNLGRGDTFHTTEQMKAWIEKYAFQTARLAPLLKGQTLKETVNNIYNFLYSHVQYEADGALQQLRSPACSWMQRKEGVDCKSFSVFASSILVNLGIKHFIRQIRQPGFHPSEFTHVYVVVPADQNQKELSGNATTLVLDATKHQNIESKYIQKVDMPMLAHVGLNAPVATATVAPAQNQRTLQIIENFNIFCDFLVEKGVPVATVNALRLEVNKYTSQGQDPQFKIVDAGILIGGRLIELRTQEEGLQFAVGAVTGAAAVGKKLINLLPSGFLADTFGSVFANGFDLSCWGSATSPSESKKILAEVHMPFFQKCFEIIGNSQDIEQIKKYLNWAISFAHSEGFIKRRTAETDRYADCSQKGWAVIADFMDGVKSQLDALISSLEMQFEVEVRQKESTATWSIPTSMTKFNKPYAADHRNHRITYPQVVSLRLKNEGSTRNPTSGRGRNGSRSQTNGSGSSEGGNNTGLIIGGVALAALPLLFFMKKDPTAKRAKKASK